MNMHLRPKIQNGPVAKRTRSAASHQPAPRAAKPASWTPLTTVAPLWTGVSVGTLTQSGLAVLGLDERLQSTEFVAKEKTASRSRVLLGLIGCGVLLAGGFMFSLRDHFTAYAIGHEEVKLKSQLEQAEAEQQQLDINLKRAGSPQALDRAAREVAGLVPLALEPKQVVSRAKQKTAAEKAKIASAPKTNSKAAKR